MCGKNERMRVRALHGHVLPGKRHIFIRFLALICVFVTEQEWKMSLCSLEETIFTFPLIYTLYIINFDK